MNAQIIWQCGSWTRVPQCQATNGVRQNTHLGVSLHDLFFRHLELLAGKRFNHVCFFPFPCWCEQGKMRSSKIVIRATVEAEAVTRVGYNMATTIMAPPESRPLKSKLLQLSLRTFMDSTFDGTTFSAHSQ